MTVVVFFMLAVVSVAYMAAPVIRQRYWPFLQRSPVAEVERAKREGIWAISDVDSEFEMGKLTKEDYESLRNKLKSDLHEVMKAEREVLGGAAVLDSEGVPSTLRMKLLVEVLRICGLKR